MFANPKIFSEAACAALLPDPDMTVSQWAEAYRRLSAKSSAEAGIWRNSRTPYLVEIMDQLSPSSPTRRVVFMKSSQIGGSECGFNWIGFLIANSGGPTMMVQPSDDVAEKVSKTRIAPMIEDTPILRKKISIARSRDSGNTLANKEFQGGVLTMVSAASAVSLRSMPIKNLFCDEVSSYSGDVGGEGDAVELAEKRTQTFSRRKIFLCSTPLIKDACRIEAEYEKSDKRKYFVPCPNCGEMQPLEWGQMRWERDKPETAEYECIKCKALIQEHMKTEMMAKGKWVATQEHDGHTVGYHLSSLYSPIGWKSWAEIVREFLTVKNDAPRLQAFVNTVLAQTWEADYAQKIGVDSLQARAENYKELSAPTKAVLVTAGVDVQDNRVAISLYGWGEGEESWVLSHQEIYGDPASMDLWRQVDNVLNQAIIHESGAKIYVSATGVDSGGHYTHEVYQYCRERRAKHIFALKGQSQKNKPPIGKPTKVDINYKGIALKSGAEVYPVGTDTIKNSIYARLKHNSEGAGYIHFYSDLKPEFYEQLTSERLHTRYVKGFPVREWTKKSSQRNEALDTAVYAYAALHYLYMRKNRKTIFSQYADLVKKADKNKPTLENNKPRNPDLTDEKEKIESNKPDLPKIKKGNILVPRRKGFLNSW